jgi:hypothetical protein
MFIPTLPIIVIRLTPFFILSSIALYHAWQNRQSPPLVVIALYAVKFVLAGIAYFVVGFFLSNKILIEQRPITDGLYYAGLMLAVTVFLAWGSIRVFGAGVIGAAVGALIIPVEATNRDLIPYVTVAFALLLVYPLSSAVFKSPANRLRSDPRKRVFISYRRSSSWQIARAIFNDLRQHGFDVFMDVESIPSGHFEHIIMNQIAARAHFIVILNAAALERCHEPGDWLRREIEQAIAIKRNVVPLLVDGFDFKDAAPHLTGNLAELPRYNALNVPSDYFDEAMIRLRQRFLKQPVQGEIIDTPADEHEFIERRIAAVVAGVGEADM